MNKNVKILSALLVSVMGLGLSSTNKVNNTKDDNGPLVVKDVLRANAIEGSGATVEVTDAPIANNLVSNVLAQVNAPVDGKINIRFIAGIDTYTYGAAQFNIAVKNTEGKVQVEKSVAVNHAYLGIVVDGETKYAYDTDLFGEGYNYLIAYTLTDVPVDYWNYNFEVTASIGTDSENLTATSAEVKTKYISNMIEAVETRELVLNSGVWHPHGGFFLQLGWSNDFLANDLVSQKASGTLNGIEYEFDFNRISGEKAIVFETDSMMSSGIETATYTLKVNLIDVNAIQWTTSVRVVGGVVATLDAYKTSAVSELEDYPASKNYMEGLYTEENWTLLTSYITEGTKNINNATSYDGVDAALATAKSNIDNVEQRDLSIDEAVTSAKNELTKYVNDLDTARYTEENWTIVQNLLTEGLAAIELGTSEIEIQTTLNDYISQIAAVETLKSTNKLTMGWVEIYAPEWLHVGWTEDTVTSDNAIYKATKENTVVKVYDEDLNEYSAKINLFNGNKTLQLQVTDLLTAHGDVRNIKFIVFVQITFDDAIFELYVQFDKAKATQVDGLPAAKTLDEIKAEALTELNSYASESNYSETNWALVENAISSGAAEINNATDKAGVQTALSNALKAIDDIEKDKLVTNSFEVLSSSSIVGAGVNIYLKDETLLSGLTSSDITITLDSFDTDFVGYEVYKTNNPIKFDRWDGTGISGNRLMFILNIGLGVQDGYTFTHVFTISFTTTSGVYYSTQVTFVNNAVVINSAS